MYSTVKYTDDSRDSRMEWKIRIQHDPYSLDLAPFDFVFFPPTEIGSAWKSV